MKIVNIEGIGPTYAAKLQKIGVRTTNALLKQGASKRGREDLASRSGISETLILEWVNLADLIRIKGVGEEYSDLLEEAGVDSVKELRNRNAANLTSKMEEVNGEKKLVRRTPSVKVVSAWIEQARELPPKVSH